jgi:integrase/recombinase XerC
MESLVPLANWQDPASRRREALRALQERDEGALQALLQVYLQTKSRKRTALSPRTLETYQLALRDYLSWIWPKEAPAPRFPLQKATSDDLDRYLAELQARGGHLTASPKPFRPAAAATYLAGIRAFYRALEWAGVAHPPHVSAPHDPTPAYERRPALPPSLYQTLLQRLTPQDPRSLRDRVAVRLMGEGGLRISEVVALNLEDLLLPERLLLVRKGKGGKARSLPLSRSLIEDLQHWLKVRASHAWPHETALLVHLRGRKAGGRRMGARGLR